MIRRLMVYLLILFLLPFLWQCGKKADFEKLDPAFLWEKEQTVIETASGTKHTWSGFAIKNEFFVPTKTISKFILWKETKGETEIAIHYLLKGMSVDVFINSIKRFKLKPRYQLDPFKTKAVLSKGFNFIEFRTKGKSQLKIKAIETGGAPAASHHIPAGETITRFYPAGSGEIRLTGKGKLHAR
ncbi:MAG: hypothetical protein GY950_34080, partial [bacterium]|nr:hypothetical protein [bacterium]